MVEGGGMTELRIEQNVSEMLRDGDVELGGIEGVIWSHWYVR